MLRWALNDALELSLPFRMQKIGAQYGHWLFLSLQCFDAVRMREPYRVHLRLDGVTALKDPQTRSRELPDPIAELTSQ